MGKSRGKKKYTTNTLSTKPSKKNQSGDGINDSSSSSIRPGQRRTSLDIGAHVPSKFPPSSSTSTTSTNTGLLLPLQFPAHLPRPPNHDFLIQHQSPYQESFQAALDTSYEGFVFDDRFHETKIGSSITENEIQNCLERMQSDGFFQKDVTQPFGLGTKCSPTYVTRCLVGDPGTTYKYLGLRMFAHPWIPPNDASRLPTATASPSETKETTRMIYDLSVSLSQATRDHLDKLDKKRKRRGAPPTQGRATFDICLINRMDPMESSKSAEPSSKILPHLATSVSWHADSSLEHYSTIAVYQTLLGEATKSPSSQQINRKSQPSSLSSSSLDHPWYVAMRVTPHCEGPTAAHQRKRSMQSTVDVSIPPIAALLPSGSVYYLLDDFNHHHQHTVLRSGSTPSSATSNKAKMDPPLQSPIRYSCTFRLLRESHSIQYMIERCQSAVSHFHKKGLKVWRSEQLLLLDIESDWIRQFYIQGSHHYDLLWDSYWREPFRVLLKYWSQLEERTHQILQWLELAARGRCFVRTSLGNPPPPKAERKIRDKEKKALVMIQGLLDRGGGGGGGEPDDDVEDEGILYKTMAEFLDERAKMRELWAKRERDHAFSELTPELRPMPVPLLFDDSGETKTTKTKSSSKAGGHHTAAPADMDSRSPLPGQPNRLREIAVFVRALGIAFVSGKMNEVPSMTFTTSTIDQPSHGTSPLQDDHHSKSPIWPGWGNTNMTFGLELQKPWAGAILDGRKEIETRSYDLPPSLIGKRIWILESPSGQSGVSAMGNVIDFEKTSEHGCQIVGWCRFTSCIRYTCQDDFEADELRHLVLSTSGYGWKTGKTEAIYGWVVGEHVRVPSRTSFVSATRRMRSLFELKQGQRSQQQKQEHQNQNGKRKKVGGGSAKHNHGQQQQKTKKKRY